jgi:hypothetical protein
MDSLHWEFDSWSATRADDVVLYSILASGSGPDWQRRVREAQKNGETLTLKDEGSEQIVPASLNRTVLSVQKRHRGLRWPLSDPPLW